MKIPQLTFVTADDLEIRRPPLSTPVEGGVTVTYGTAHYALPGFWQAVLDSRLTGKSLGDHAAPKEEKRRLKRDDHDKAVPERTMLQLSEVDQARFDERTEVIKNLLEMTKTNANTIIGEPIQPFGSDEGRAALARYLTYEPSVGERLRRTYPAPTVGF